MTEELRGGYGIMVGVGCGRTIHSHLMPIDTAVYLSAAESIRKRETYEKGALVLADVDVPSEIVRYREERLRRILEVLGTEGSWDLVKQSIIPRNQSDDVVLSKGIPPEDESYFKREVQDAIILLRDGGVKVGWVLDEVKNTGGEAHFDTEIAQNRKDIRFAYEVSSDTKKRKKTKNPSLIGVPLVKDFGQRKPPYLVKKPEAHVRICLPKDDEQLLLELDKISRNAPSDVALERILQFCNLINGKVTSGDPLDIILGKALEPFKR